MEEHTRVIWYKVDQRLSASLVLLCTKKAESRSQWFVNCPYALGAVGSLRLQWLVGLFLSDPQTLFVTKYMCSSGGRKQFFGFFK